MPNGWTPEAHGAWVQAMEGAHRGLLPRARTPLAGGRARAAHRTEGLLAAQQEPAARPLCRRVSAEVLAAVADSAVMPSASARCANGDTARALRSRGLAQEGTEATLVLWALTKAVRDI